MQNEIYFYRLYKFDYCPNCKILFKPNDSLCTVCNVQRFKNVDGSISKKMKSFFYIRDLKDIQKALFKGKININ